MMEKIQKANGSVVNISELLISLTNNVICRVALGRRYDERKFNNLLQSAIELLGCFSLGAYIPSLRWVDQLSGLERRVDKVAKEFDEFLEGVLEEHANKNRVDVKCEDLVDVLLEIQRDNTTGFPLEDDMIKALILDIFLAGTDTTFTSLEWALCELLRHPQAMKELQQEALKIGQGRSMITEDQLEKMVYLKAVLKETLRLHTPLPLLVPRESTQDVQLLGYDIPSGTQVFINAWAISRDPSKWEAPEEFRPERFLNNPPIDYKGFHFELIPFGAGRRGCPGSPSEDSFTDIYRRFFSPEESAEEEEAVTNACTLAIQAMEHVRRSPPRPILRRTYILRDREVANERLMKDYFDPTPVHGSNVFRRRFRMSQRLFLHIIWKLSIISLSKQWARGDI
ncbi:putative cytochrome P450 [Helianthus annuus]|nr:putative cytochrome P450 [Helianthus annuus]